MGEHRASGDLRTASERLAYDRAYRAKAVEFDEIAEETKHAELKQRYRELAQAYRALADTRERAIGDGSAEPHMLPQ